MSTHEIPVVRLDSIEPHPNADSLGLVQIFGWTCAVRLGQFSAGDLCVYIPPDFVVDTTRPEFTFLADGKSNSHRIKVKRLRGTYSQGLVIAAPAGLSENDNAMEQLGIVRYEPPENASTGGDNEPGPSGVYAPKYDVESMHRYPSLLTAGEPVVATEKLHGCNGRYVWSSVAGRMYCGSCTGWKAEADKSVWWTALRRNPWIADWCRTNPDVVLYGEVFGQVQGLKYGASSKDAFFAAFDILDHDRWLSYDEARDRTWHRGIIWAPLVYQGPFDATLLAELADKLDSRWPGARHLAEGIVVRPVVERTDSEVGRVQLKIVSNRYLSR